MLGRFFQCDPDLRLAGSEIYLDATEPRPVGIVSHAHADHIARHERFVATPATAAFMRLRLGEALQGDELAFRTPLRLDRWTVELFPAGHIFGSAMVRVSAGGESLLYTGDVRLAEGLTAEPADVPAADALVMESTYGSPEWKFPSREDLGGQLRSLVSRITGSGRTAVLLAYSLGKAQEVMAMLADVDLPVVVHPTVAEVCSVYERFGVALGRWEVWEGQGRLFGRPAVTDLRGRIVIVPPHMKAAIRRIDRRETVALTGWALHPWRVHGADHALPLSDHADYEELLDLVRRSRARTVYSTHGSPRFARDLRERGVDAELVRQSPQSRLV